MFFRTFHNFLKQNICHTFLKRGTAHRKRFYKRCNVLSSNGAFEIALDSKKLKTPKGNVFAVESEALALAVAAEWNAQKEKILQSSMHLTGLCWTAIDNPDKLTKEAIADELVSYLDSDTIFYFSAEDDDLRDRQNAEWLPVADWLCNRYKFNIRPTSDITGPVISDADKQTLRKYLLSYNLWAMFGFRFSIEALKSVSLGLACVDRFITAEKATSLSRLEEDYQSKRWGRVEWAHDLNEQSTRARVAAGTIFVQTNSSIYLTKTKQALSM